MQNIDQFFKTHKNDFDELKADPAIWDEIEQELNQDIRPIHRRRHFWLKIAAAIALIVSISLFLYPSHEVEVVQEVGLELDMYFPDISLRNPQGELISISELKGKVVLVEFWASYSVVCTEDHCYYFKPIYEEFRDKGFEIYAISVDSSAVNWVNAIEKDKLDWVQVSDLQGDQSPVIDKYQVDDLPTTFLINEEGKIIDKNIDSEELKDKLSQILAFN